jgi:hypothetical protein
MRTISRWLASRMEVDLARGRIFATRATRKSSSRNTPRRHAAGWSAGRRAASACPREWRPCPGRSCPGSWAITAETIFSLELYRSSTPRRTEHCFTRPGPNLHPELRREPHLESRSGRSSGRRRSASASRFSAMARRTWYETRKLRIFPAGAIYHVTFRGKPLRTHPCLARVKTERRGEAGGGAAGGGGRPSFFGFCCLGAAAGRDGRGAAGPEATAAGAGTVSGAR